jgi:DNA-binding FadR family transcriptional regulator
MPIEQEQQTLFAVATGENLPAMQQAIRAAHAFEHELLRDGRVGHTIQSGHLTEQVGLSRSASNEAVRILQSRGIVRAKPGPNGGLVTQTPSIGHLRELVARYGVHTRMSTAAMEEARRSVALIRAALPSDSPAMTMAEFMEDALDQLSNWPMLPTEQRRQRAARIARQLAIRILQSFHIKSFPESLRVGHEAELCERFGTSLPVMRQAIRILQAESLVETRRGRGHGLFVAAAQPGPVSRLIALWLLGQGLSLKDILDIEHPLRAAVALLAARSRRCVAGHPVLNLQHQAEAAGAMGLSGVIEMEKNISWLSGNAFLDLFLRTLTVYKIGRGHYQELDGRGLESYPDINRRFLRNLMARDETGIQRDCDAKNACLGAYDLRLAGPESRATN